MTTLAVDKLRHYSVEFAPYFEELPVIASDIIYEGAAVGANASGIMRPLVSGDPFRGFAVKQADNSAGSASAINVKVRREGIVRLTVTNLAAETEVGTAVYATDDDTFTTAPAGSRIGTITKWESSTTGLVHFKAAQIQQGPWRRVVAKTTDYTVLASDNGTLFTTTGASGTVIFTLPAVATLLQGFTVEFFNAVGQTMKVASAAADGLITFNDLDADIVSFEQASELIGASCRATLISATKWAIQLFTEETQTVAVTT